MFLELPLYCVTADMVLFFLLAENLTETCISLSTMAMAMGVYSFPIEENAALYFKNVHVVYYNSIIFLNLYLFQLSHFLTFVLKPIGKRVKNVK